MSAAAADRRHARSVELAMEDRVAGIEVLELVGRLRSADQRFATFIQALIDARSEEAALLALVRARANHIIEVSTELAGILDRVRVGEPQFDRVPVAVS